MGIVGGFSSMGIANIYGGFPAKSALKAWGVLASYPTFYIPSPVQRPLELGERCQASVKKAYALEVSTLLLSLITKLSEPSIEPRCFQSAKTEYNGR